MHIKDISPIEPHGVITLQTDHVYSTLKRRGNGRFYVVSMWNTRGVFEE